MRAWPCRETYAAKTPIWQFVILPAEPVYCRATTTPRARASSRRMHRSSARSPSPGVNAATPTKCNCNVRPGKCGAGHRAGAPGRRRCELWRGGCPRSEGCDQNARIRGAGLGCAGSNETGLQDHRCGSLYRFVGTLVHGSSGCAPSGRLAWGRTLGRVGGAHHAVQDQSRPPAPYPGAATSGHQLAGLRGRLARSRQPDRLVLHSPDEAPTCGALAPSSP